MEMQQKFGETFPYKNINKRNESKTEFVKSSLYSAETNPNEWFAELYFICRCLEEEYNCNSFGHAKMINQIIYNTKPDAYQMQ
jgi:hypothetical protein